MHESASVPYIYIDTVGECIRCDLCSLILLTSLVSLLCMCLIYTFFLLLSFYESTIIAGLVKHALDIME